MPSTTSAYCVVIFVIVSRISEISSWYDTRDYCKARCPNATAKHIVCQRNNYCGPMRSCYNIPITKHFRQRMLDIHNYYRELIASGTGGKEYGNPGATNMQYMNYDLELELAAACWAYTCTFEIAPCVSFDQNMAVFEHVYMEYNPPVLHPENAIKFLFDYIKHANADVIKSFKNGPYHFFTQLVWANTNRVGCAQSLKFQEGYLRHFIVCHYRPAGNVEGEEVYRMANDSEAIGSDCPRSWTGQLMKGHNSKFPSLCGTSWEATDDVCVADMYH